MESILHYTEATEADLNELVVGHRAGYLVPFTRASGITRLRNGSVGVICREWDKGPERGLVQPVVLICREEDQRRLCGRFAQLRGDLSPLTAWCHLIKPEYFEWIESNHSLTRDADLRGYQAAWIGLVIAEALLLSERPLSKLRLAACFATQSFAVARTAAIWERIPITEVIDRFDTARNLFSEEPRYRRLRSVLEPIWTTLSLASSGLRLVDQQVYAPLVSSLQSLNAIRAEGRQTESWNIAEHLIHLVPEVEIVFRDLDNLTPEQRVQEYDKLIALLDAGDFEKQPMRRIALAFVAGYLATVAAGGGPSLSLTEASASRWPDITAWAYVLGSVGEKVVWTSSFDGLGRLVGRELLRPFRFDEAPTSDIALDEARVLIDPQLSDPFVHLRVKQARAITVSLFPGVVVPIPLTESTIAQEPSKLEAPDQTASRQIPQQVRAGNDPMAILANLLWPYLEDRFARSADPQRAYPSRNRDMRNRNRPKQPSQSGLPFRRTDDC
jgi:hypothetical protein